MFARKSISIIIALSMLLCLLPTMSFAADGFKVVDMDKKSGITDAGLDANTKIVNTAKNSAKWNLDDKGSISFGNIQHDFSAYSNISFALHLESKDQAVIIFRLLSQNETTDGDDYYSKEITLSPGEWKNFSFNYADLAKNRTPIGFNQIDAIQIFATGWNNKFEPGAVMYIDSFTLSGTPTSITGTPTSAPVPTLSPNDDTVGTNVYYSSDFEGSRANLTGFNNQKKTNTIEIKKSADNSYIYFESLDAGSDSHLDMTVNNAARFMVVQLDMAYNGTCSNGNIQYKDASNTTGIVATFNGGNMKINGGPDIATLNGKGKFTNIALAFDFATNKVDAYADGKQVVKQADFGAGLTSIKMLRIYISPNPAGSNLMVDNYKVYEGKGPREIKAEEAPTAQAKVVTDNKAAIQALGKDVVALSVGGNGIYYNGEKHAIDAPAFIKDDRTLVPVRAVSEAFGLKVDWDAATRTATIDGKSKIIIDNTEMTLPNGRTYTLDVPAAIFGDRTFLPLRALCEQILGKTVTWNGRGLIIVGDKAFEAHDATLQEINNYLLYDRPTPAQLVETFNNYNNNAHPRVMMTPDIYKRVKYNYAHDELVKSWGDGVISAADKLFNVPLPKYELPDNYRLLATSRNVYSYSRTLSMAYILTGDKKYADRLYEIFDAAGHFPDWNSQHFLDIGEMTCAFAIGYDWLYDVWTPEQRKFLEDTILNYGIKVAEKAYYNQLGSDGWWTPGNTTNWNVVCNGGIAMGAIALFDKDPKLMSTLISFGVRDVESMMNSFYPDGAWFEGIGYWAYTMSYTVNMFSSLQSAFGTDFNLTKAPGLAKSVFFSMAGNGPVAINNYHDAGESYENSDTYFWLSNQYNIPGVTNVRLYNMQERGFSGSVFDILWYDTDIKGTDFSLPKDVYLKDVEFVAMRNSWVDSDGAWLSYHAGEANVNHSHLDSGTFVIDMIGERWALDIGGDDYNLDGYFGANKHKFYRLRPEGHNLYVINPDGSEGQSTSAFCPVETLVSKERGAYSIADLTPAYEQYAKRARRGYMLANDRRSVIIRDEIDFKGSSEIYWFSHTKANIEIVDDHTAILTQNGKRIKVMVDSDISGYKLSVMDAVPLPSSPVIAGQNANAGIRKLTIQGKASGKKYIQVKFIPLDDPAADLPLENVALDSWSIPDGPMLQTPTLEMLYKDGEEISSFKPTTGNYVFTAPYDATEVPVITAKGGDDVDISIQQSQTLSDPTIVTVSLKADPTLYRKYVLSVNILPKLENVDGWNRHQVLLHDASAEPEPTHPASNVSNNDTSAESRWAAEGANQWVQIDLGSEKQISAAGLSWWKGNERVYTFSVAVSTDGKTWEEVIAKTPSSGKIEGFEIFTFPKTYTARYMRYIGYGNSVNSWNSVTEFAALHK